MIVHRSVMRISIPFGSGPGRQASTKPWRPALRPPTAATSIRISSSRAVRPGSYRQVERLAPDLFARIRRLVERGQWHITGGQYLQPDGNLPTEMGWRRQILHGQRYFADCFGVQPTIGYNVDSFGQPATLPDILGSLGYTGYVFGRPDVRQVQLPAQTFRWRGPGGGELSAFRIIPTTSLARAICALKSSRLPRPPTPRWACYVLLRGRKSRRRPHQGPYRIHSCQCPRLSGPGTALQHPTEPT